MNFAYNGVRREHLLLVAVGFVVVAPLLLRGPSCGHDFDFHLLNWLEVANQFRGGTLHPTWATTPAWNAGEPRFVFYPPASWVFGAMLSLVAASTASFFHLSSSTAFTVVPALFTFFTLLAGGIVLFGIARRWTERTAALLSAVLYMCNPYALFTAYERTAYGEMLSIALFPVLIAESLRGVPGDHPASLADAPGSAHGPSIIRIAIVVALLWLSNAPAAVMGCYVLLGLSVVRLGLMLLRAEPVAACLLFARKIASGALLGFALPAFFLLPAILERPWVQLGMAVIVGMRPADNTLFHHTGDPEHDAVLHTASVVALWLAAGLSVACAGYFVRYGRGPRARQVAFPQPSSTQPAQTSAVAPALLAACGVCLLLMLTPLTLLLWRYLPDLAILQFPWRFLAVLAAVIALLSAWSLRGLRLRGLPLSLITFCIAFALMLPAYRSFHQACDAEDTPAARLARFTASDASARGSEPTDEYTPSVADNDVLAEHNPPFWLLNPDAGDDAPSPDQEHGGPAPRAFHLHTDRPVRLVLNLREYPAWSVTRNGVVVPERVSRSDGLLAIPLPAGDADLRIMWRSNTVDRIGDAVSAAALFVLAAAWWRERRERRAECLPR